MLGKILCAVAFLGAWPLGVSAVEQTPVNRDGAAQIQRVISALPITFEENRGQFKPRLNFVARGSGYLVGLSGGEMTLAFSAREVGTANSSGVAKLQLKLANANTHAKARGVERVEQIGNYFWGQGLSQRIVDVPHYAKVRFEDVYPGVHLVYYGNGRELEHDFIVTPGANPGQIRLIYSGVDKRVAIREGALVLSVAGREIVFRKPFAYQSDESGQKPVDVSFTLQGRNTVGFMVGAYDKNKPLIIDPILSYSSYLAGSGGSLMQAIAVDSSGNVYVTGSTSSTDFPVLNAYKSTLAGNQEAFITKIKADGSGLGYSTYLGSTKKNNGSFIYSYGIAVDSTGSAIVVGDPGTAAFPVTTGAYQTTKTGTPVSFVTKLSATGNALAFSTYLNYAAVKAVAVDSSGSVYVTGTARPGFVTSAGAYQTASRNITSPYDTGFIAKLNATGTALGYATFLGGSGADIPRAIAVDSAGIAYVTGTAASVDFPMVLPFKSYLAGKDAFVTKLNATGTSLLYSTYFGGSRNEDGNAIAVDSSGAMYITGDTNSDDLPLARPFQAQLGYPGGALYNAYVTKFAPDGAALSYSTYFGGKGCLGAGVTSCSGDPTSESGTGIAVNAAGEAVVVGISHARQFPALNYIQSVLGDGSNITTFTLKMYPDGARAYSTILGTPTYDVMDYNVHPAVALNAAGDAVVASTTVDMIFPTTSNAYQPGTPLPANSVSQIGVVFKIATSGILPQIETYSGGYRVRVQNPQPGGTITLKNWGSAIDMQPIVDGSAIFYVGLPAGVHKLTAVNDVNGKESAPYMQTVKLP